jgi:hypothetical protein
MTSVLPVTKYIPTAGFANSLRVRGGTSANLFVHAVNSGGNLYSAVSGVEAGFPDGRSSFNMSCLDVNVTESNIGFSQTDGTITSFSVPAATSFRFVCDIINWTNRLTLATAAKAQVGLMGTAHATFATLIGTGPQAASESAIYVEFADSKMRLFFGTTASAYVHIPATLTAFSIRIEYRAGRSVKLYLNNKDVATIQTTVATSALQVFARAGHLAAYTAATDDPIRFEVDSVSVAFDKT